MPHLVGLIKAVDWSHPPGWLSVAITDHNGAVSTLVDKAPVFDPPHADVGAEVEIECRVVASDPAGEVLTVIPLHGVTTSEGRDSFQIASDQLLFHRP